MWTVLVTLIILRHIFPKCLLALLASKRHLHSFRQSVILAFGVTFSAVVPLLAAGCANGYLRVQYVFAGQKIIVKTCRYGVSTGQKHAAPADQEVHLMEMVLRCNTFLAEYNETIRSNADTNHISEASKWYITKAHSVSSIWVKARCVRRPVAVEPLRN
jgi:hypothetical protein